MKKPAAVMQVVSGLIAGGAQRVAVNLANGLAGLGYESHLMATREEGPLSSSISQDVHTCYARRTSPWDVSGLRRMARYVDDHGIDIVHGHAGMGTYLLRLVLRLCERKPILVVHNHSGPSLNDWKQSFGDWLLLRNADAYISVSEELQRNRSRLLGLPDDRCLYIENGVRVFEEEWIGNSRPTVVQVANLLPVKAHRVALQAAALVREKVPDLRWNLICSLADSDRACIDETHALIASLGLSGCVEVHDAVPDVRAELRRAHLGVLTSDSEGLSMAILEYLAEALPVVITDVGQAPRIVGASNSGLVVPPQDPERFAEAVVQVLGSGERAREMGRRGRTHVIENSSDGVMVRRVSDLYQRLLERRRG